ncbi:hypothetical protein LOD99_1229 [Oopsacas minuta]|uniref:Protein-tyrosine sulfotransferase n=1 Tax=Oopsacas minuta TaxID=111878 RepID=A0AAV7K5W8_9METZ|nr:hypothetical protein LOD99_1229 [Oopsacas minuta]
MILQREIILDILLFIIFMYVGRTYISEVRRTNELREEMSNEILLGVDRQEYESNVSREEELALKVCKEEIQRKRAYLDKCIDYNVKQEQYKEQIELTEGRKEEGLQEILKIGQLELDECFKDRNGLKDKHPDCFPKVSKSPNEKNIFRNSSVNKIKYFILFLGHPRCGSSIIKAVLDAHPHVIIATESNAVQIWTNHVKKQIKFDRYDLFNILRNRSIFIADKIGRNVPAIEKYYTLQLPGLYMGEYKDYIHVIGDKEGLLMNIDRGFDDSEEFFRLLDRFQSFVGYPLKFFYIVRNPYDLIATMYLYSISAELRQELFTNNRTLKSTQSLSNMVRNHVASFKKLQRHINHYGERLLTLYNEDLISNPKLFIRRMCNHMGIYCNDYYIEKTSAKAFSSVTRSRYSVEWKQDAKNLVDTAIRNYPFLNRYSFED